MKKIFLLLFVLLLATGSANCQLFKRNTSRSVERSLFGKTSGKSRELKIKEPRKVLKAKKKQESNERKNKKSYAKSIKRSQKRTIEIQTPEVQARMKQNQKESLLRNKAKKKRVKSNTRRAGKKYN